MLTILLALSLRFFAVPVPGLWHAENMGRTFDEDGFDKHGFDHNGRHRNGTTFGDDGFDYDGIDVFGRNRAGFNKAGFDKDGLTAEEAVELLNMDPYLPAFSDLPSLISLDIDEDQEYVIRINGKSAGMYEGRVCLLR